MLHAEVEARRVALYDAAVRDELVLRAWRTGGVVAAVPLARGQARGLLTFWLDVVSLDAWQSGPGCAAVRRLLSRFAVGGADPEELTFETATSNAAFDVAGRSMANDPTPDRFR